MTSTGSSPDLAHMAGKTVVLSGTSRGIGAVLLRAFAQAGATVVALGRPSAALDVHLNALRREGLQVELARADLGDPDALDRALARIVHGHPVIDAVVANAGINGRLVPLQELRPEELREAFQVNLHAVHQMLCALDAPLRRAAAPRVLALSSAAASKLSANWAAYAASKLALEGLLRVHAAEWQGTAMRSNIVRPGPTRTAMRAAAYPAEDPMTIKAPEALLPLFGWLLGPQCHLHGECVQADAWLAALPAHAGRSS